MRGLLLTACGLMAMGFAGAALAQGDVIAERRAGLRAQGVRLVTADDAKASLFAPAGGWR
jgi:hypothetical protein